MFQGQRPFVTSSPASDLTAGDQLDGFRLLELLNQGRWSAVFKAVEISTGRLVALKVPPRHLAASQYLRESQIGSQLDHPRLPRFLPIAEEAKSRAYLATEFVEGRSLHDEMHARPIPIAEALAIGAQICDGLDWLHRHHIIHADVKPGNILLCQDGSIRIIDFGIARWAKTRPKNRGGFPQHVGTPEYMPPEIVKGKRGDARTDLYSLGAVLYEMITGHRPFDEIKADHRLSARLVGDPVAPSVSVPGLSPQVEEILLRALARRPADRYQSAAAMKADLEAPDTVVVAGLASRLQRPRLSRLWLPVAGLVGGALLVPVVLFFLFLAFFRK